MTKLKVGDQVVVRATVLALDDQSEGDCSLRAATGGTEFWVLQAECELSSERRERVATAVLQGMLASGDLRARTAVAVSAVDYADALIAALDAPKGGA